MERTRIIKSLGPSPSHMRHSEGDFIHLNDGGILFIYTRYRDKGYGDSDPADLVKMYSYDNGETWSEPTIVFTCEQFGVKCIDSVSMIRLNNGDIGLTFIAKSFDSLWLRNVVIARSSDEGQTFGNVVDCSLAPFNGRHGLNNSRMRKLASGRLIYPNSNHPGAIKPWQEGKRKPQPTSHTHGNFVYSDDDGKTWQTSADTIYMTFTGSNPGIQEGEIVEIQPGILKCFFRTDKMYQYVSLSFDNGDHWTVPQPSVFTGVCSPITIRKNPFTNKTYAFWNPIPAYNGKPKVKGESSRTPFAIAEVDDQVSKILWMDYIEDDKTAGYAYTAPIFINENEVLLAYCAGKPTKDFDMLARLNISKINLNEPQKEQK